MKLATFVVAVVAATLMVVPTASGMPSDCNVQYVCFGFDASGSVRGSIFDAQIAGIGALAEQLAMVAPDVKFAAYAMNERVPLNNPVANRPGIPVTTSFVGQGPLNTAISAFDDATDGCIQCDDISTTLTACGDDLLTKSGVRVMIHVTDGFAPGPDASHVAAAQPYKDDGIIVITGGSGRSPNNALLNMVATSPAFNVAIPDFDEIPDKILTLLEEEGVCDMTEAPTPTPKPFKCARKNCRFRLNSGGAIIDKTGAVRVGVVGGTGEALIRDGPATLPISDWDPTGLRQAFSPSYFKAFSLAGTFMSGVGYEVPQQNQGSFLDKLRICLPVRAYQVLNNQSPPQVVENVNTMEEEDCIFLRVRYPEMTDTASQR